jgi:hypothetical protein
MTFVSPGDAIRMELRLASSFLKVYIGNLIPMAIPMFRQSFGATSRDWVQLALIDIPTSLIEPRIVRGGDGHWITGTVMIIVAYASSLLPSACWWRSVTLQR